MWAGSHHLDVTNNSYYADPWLFNCRNDPGQRAIWKAEQRAIRYAMQQGVTVVAALSISGPTVRLRGGLLHRLGRLLVTEGRELSALLGHDDRKRGVA